MCFVYDGDWYAEVVEDTIESSDVDVSCHECHQRIPHGVKHRYVHQEERDEDEWDGTYLAYECQSCYGSARGCEYCDKGYTEEPRPFEQGETYDWRCCLNCNQVLVAIKAAELEAGCAESESQPLFGELKQTLWDDSRRGDNRYLEKLRQLHPDFPREHLVILLDDEDDVKKYWNAGEEPTE